MVFIIYAMKKAWKFDFNEYLGEKTVTKPIPTPSRSYLLSTLKTLVLAPLMVIGAMPETNEIEISIWGGANRPYISPNSSEIITFTVESCELQILNAQVKLIFLAFQAYMFPVEIVSLDFLII